MAIGGRGFQKSRPPARRFFVRNWAWTLDRTDQSTGLRNARGNDARPWIGPRWAILTWVKNRHAGLSRPGYPPHDVAVRRNRLRRATIRLAGARPTGTPAVAA